MSGIYKQLTEKFPKVALGNNVIAHPAVRITHKSYFYVLTPFKEITRGQ